MPELIGFHARAWLAVAAALLLTACLDSDGGNGQSQEDPDDGDGEGSGGSEVDPLVEEVRSLAEAKGLDGTPADGRVPVFPDDDELTKLGQLLFFSASLSGQRDVACASCHHPELAMGDGLSLPVGVGSVAPEHLGLDRQLDPEQDLDPRSDGGPNVPRNSQTILNVALYNRALFHDGRLFVLDEAVEPGGQGQNLRTPESGNVAHNGPGDNLLEVQALFPLVSDQEMRGFTHVDRVPSAYREMLVDRLAEPADGPGASWQQRFADAFPDQEDPISLENVQKALGAYQASLIFVDSPWRRFLDSSAQQALSEQALRGARLFLKDTDAGGFGCVNCHAGDRFTDEGFYNVGFPQIGRGKRQGAVDSGRWGVTREDEDKFAFRVPSLLNVSETAPYGHAGTFQSLERAVRWHLDPEYWITRLDEVLLGLAQFDGSNVLTLYPDAGELSQAVLDHESFEPFSDAMAGVSANDEQIDALVAFLESLSDDCLAEADCLAPWTPSRADDPDGFLLVRDEPFVGGSGGTEPPEYPDSVDLSYPSTSARTTFADVVDCDNGLAGATNSGQSVFVQREDLGLDARHGFTEEGWTADGQSGLEPRMFSGGITATHLDNDCWPDLVFTGGEYAGLVFYLNQGEQAGFAAVDALAEGVAPSDYAFYSAVAVADLNADYRNELLLSNISPGDGVRILSQNQDNHYQEIATLPMSRSSWGMGFSDFDGNGFPGIYIAHWSGGTDGMSPSLWANEGGDQLVPDDEMGGTSSAYLDPSFNFSPVFADFTGDGRQDLVIASDFVTSVTLEHDTEAETVFRNVTDRSVISDENGMGSAVGDFDNNGRLDWFVTSVRDRVEEPLGNWGVTGNRFYRNAGDPGGELKFEDATDEAGVRDGSWGWGACAADFNNDGFLDIFHVNGFGDVPPGVPGSDWYSYITGDRFKDNPPVLFINNGDGSFSERAADWEIDVPSQGTGVTCLDHDRDGDMDIALVDNSTGMQFFENQIGHQAGRHFLNVRLVADAPNTHALGARVYVEADVGSMAGYQEQMREVTADSSFNGQNLPSLHFGVGEATSVDIRVVWPSGAELSCEAVDVNQFLVFDQRDGSVDACPS